MQQRRSEKRKPKTKFRWRWKGQSHISKHNKKFRRWKVCESDYIKRLWKYGVWKKRFPILKGLRKHFELSQKIVVATELLFNFGRMLNDDPPEDDDEEESDDDSDTEEYRNVRIVGGDGNTIR